METVYTVRKELSDWFSGISAIVGLFDAEVSLLCKQIFFQLFITIKYDINGYKPDSRALLRREHCLNLVS